MSVHSSLSPDPIDVEVGLRLRTLRKDRGLSQTELGEALTVTFQQVQKYERGTNRVSASMLVRAARTLNVPFSALLPDEGGAVIAAPNIAGVIANTRGAEELIVAYADISSPRLRRSVLQLARSLAADGADG
jgi:transcriptional regulator with XRE-family HTH domain